MKKFLQGDAFCKKHLPDPLRKNFLCGKSRYFAKIAGDGTYKVFEGFSRGLFSKSPLEAGLGGSPTTSGFGAVAPTYFAVN